MNERPRIVFAYCWKDPWIEDIVKDLDHATMQLGYELFVIGAEDTDCISKESYIDLDNLNFNKVFYKFLKSMCIKAPNLEKEIERDFLFFQRYKDGSYANKGEIQQRLRYWYNEATLLYRAIEPDLVIVWNGLFSRRSIYAKAAKDLGIPVHYAEKGLFPNSWYTDPLGINPQSSIAKTKEIKGISEEEISQWKKRLEEIDRKGESAWEQPNRENADSLKQRLGIGENQKVIFFPGQVDTDSNIILFSPHFKKVIDALTWLVDGLPEDDYFVLAKPHPKGEATIDDFQKTLGNKGTAVSDINVLDGIALADIVVCINSTVAFEAAVRGKPVLTLGDSILSNQKYIYKYKTGISSEAQIKDSIKSYESEKSSLYDKAIEFATYVDSKKYIYKGDLDKTEEQIKRAIGTHHIKEKSMSNKDLKAFMSGITEDKGIKRTLKKIGIQVLLKIMKRCIFKKQHIE